MIIAKNLVKKYDNTCALKDASFTIEKGEWANIMGPSGSGKTTLLNLIGCLDSPTSGSLLVNGIEITTLNQKERTRFRRDNIGLVFQQFHIISPPSSPAFPAFWRRTAARMHSPCSNQPASNNISG